MLATLQAKLITFGVVLVVFLGLVSYATVEHSSAKAALAAEATYKAQVTQVEADNAADVLALQQSKAIAVKFAAVEATDASQNQAAATVAQAIIAASTAVPESASGTVAPVLANALDALRNAKMKRLISTLAVLLLASCAAPPPTVVTKVVMQTPDVPAQLLTCDIAPPVPPAVGLTQASVSVYIAELWQAHQDCYDKLGAVKQAIADSLLITR